MTYKQTKEYLPFLLQDELIKPDVNDNTLRITNKGLQFLGIYNRLPAFCRQEPIGFHLIHSKTNCNLVEVARLKDSEITTNLRRASQITIEQLNFVECFVYK